MMKVYDVFYIFKDPADEELFSMFSETKHPITEWLSSLKEDKEKPIYTEEVEDFDGNEGIVFYFRTKKAATKFAKRFGISISSIFCTVNPDFSNPWFPEGCNSFNDCYEIHGDVPGFR
jgi:hypothetical protein